MSEPINDLNYQRKLTDATKPVLLVFGASFCGPSAYMDPLVDQLLEDFSGRIAAYDVDVEECPNLTRTMQVKGTPSMILFIKAEPIATRMGTSSYTDLVEWLEKNINK